MVIPAMQHLFTSPELYPLRIDFQKQRVHFVRMSPETYRESVFLDWRTRRLDGSSYEIRLDDLLLAAAATLRPARGAHYILHPTFCCSTLLARYFEVLPFCFVLKEPMLLTQLALTSPESVRGWHEAFGLALHLLTRNYEPGQLVVIKPHEPFNALASRLLEYDRNATITFLTAPLRHFLLAVLKSQERRNWVRTRVPAAGNSAECSSLMDVDPADMTDAETAAYLWLINRYLCKKLCSGPNASRVMVLDGGQLAESPDDSVRSVLSMCGLSLDAQQFKSMIGHPLMAKHSKDLTKSYDASSRRQELAELEDRWGTEADAGVNWASSQHLGEDLCDSSLGLEAGCSR